MSSPSRASRNQPSGSVYQLAAYPPRRMRADTAARYMDVSESTFLSRVEAGIYPPGRKEFGVRLWLRDDLDGHIDRQFGITPQKDRSFADDDPFAARFRKAS